MLLGPQHWDVNVGLRSKEARPLVVFASYENRHENKYLCILSRKTNLQEVITDFKALVWAAEEESSESFRFERAEQVV